MKRSKEIREIMLTSFAVEPPVPTAALTPARALAIRWVFRLEIGVDSTQIHPTAYKNLLVMLSEESKNPMDWSDEECDEFLSSIIEARPAPKQLWGLLAEYMVANISLENLSPLGLQALYGYYFPPFFPSFNTTENE